MEMRLMIRRGGYGLALLLVVASSATRASSEPLTGNYVSLDGTVRHQLKQPGDYRGYGADFSVVGVYRQESGVCWMTKNDGSKNPGNLLLYIDEVQCCLGVEYISDKYVLTKIWVTGTGTGYQLCRNQVLKKEPG